ncbi:hypothetical protein V1517DRAFT_342440, partial [Lipomyces orientalis]
MTGDGVDDAPSLKAADRAPAVILLLKHQTWVKFDGIVEAVEYGRVVFDNLKKT